MQYGVFSILLLTSKDSINKEKSNDEREVTDLEQENKCFFCQADLTTAIGNDKQVSLYECKFCGEYELSNNLIHKLDKEESLNKKRIVAGYLYETKIAFKVLEKNPHGHLLIDEKVFNEILESPIVPKTIGDKLIKILTYLDAQSSYFGEVVSVFEQVGYSINIKEYRSMMDALEKEGLIQGPFSVGLGPNKGSSYNGYSLSLSGIERINSLKIKENNDQCFVAMRFCDEMDFLFEEAIYPGCLAAGYNAIKADKIKHTNYITNEIISNIRKSKFVIADFTYQNRGVYYEAGFATGLGKNVIQLCREDHFSKVKTKEVESKGIVAEKNEYYMHFDNAQINTIIWKAGEEKKLKKVITDWVEALFGHGNYIEPRL